MENYNHNNHYLIKIISILLIFTLIWTPMTVTAEIDSMDAEETVITLNLNGGKISGKTTAEITLKIGETYESLNGIIPQKVGYKFDGWYTASDSGTKIESADFVDGKLTALYAHWTALKYKVTFNAKGGTLNKKSMTVTYGSKYGTLAKATKDGYGFIGWYTSGGNAVTAQTIYKVAENTNLYAKWGKKYKIIFNANGGTVKKKSKNVIKGLKYGELPKPKRKGYTFLGWYTKKNGGSKVTSEKTVKNSQNSTLYARWTLSKFKVKFDPNAGSVSKKSKTVTYSKKYGKLPTPTKKGFNFKGWYTKKNKGTKITKSTVYKSTADKTLYARWSRKTITIKFNAGKGKVNKKNKKIKYNKIYGSLPKPKRSGYKFKGWYTKKSGGTKITKSVKMTYTKNKTLYAKWAKISTITFNYNKGKKGKTKTKKAVYGEKYGALPTTKRAGYEFNGWYTKKSGGTKITSTSVAKIKKNTTLYAQWKFVLNITEMLAPAGSKARPKTALNFGGVTIHNTGNTDSSANALNHAKYLQGAGSKKSASWHYCVDESVITRSIPESEIAWHAGDGGSGYGNTRTIAIEICMNDGGDLKAATDRAAYLTAYILQRKGHTIAIGNVNLFQHNYFSSYGKNCPEMIRAGKPYNWKTFIKKVNSYM